MFHVSHSMIMCFLNPLTPLIPHSLYPFLSVFSVTTVAQTIFVKTIRKALFYAGGAIHTLIVWPLARTALLIIMQ